LLFALVAASAVLTGGVVAAQMLGRGIEWQDELEIFHVAGAVFLSAATVQARRGNARIEVSDFWAKARNLFVIKTIAPDIRSPDGGCDCAGPPVSRHRNAAAWRDQVNTTLERWTAQTRPSIIEHKGEPWGKPCRF